MNFFKFSYLLSRKYDEQEFIQNLQRSKIEVKVMLQDERHLVLTLGLDLYHNRSQRELKVRD